MRVSIRYHMEFTYSTQVTESHNALRARPADDHRQRVDAYSVSVDPPSRIASHVDYWGTWVDCFGIVGRHTRLTVVAESEVETSPEAGLFEPYDRSQDSLLEFLAPTPHVRWDGRVAGLVAPVVEGLDDPSEQALAIKRWVGEHLTYTPGATEVGTSITEILEARSGVCQDYAHLALAAYRSLGMPARYVSGYLYAADSTQADAPGEDTIEVATHAWVEVLIPGRGWWGLDPTNQALVGELHIKIGHGRDYDDALPLRGVFHGPADHDLGVSVRMTREQMAQAAQQ